MTVSSQRESTSRCSCPDSMLDGVEQLILERGDIEAYQCSREDEGIAMAMGAFLVGKRPVALMEGSGIGMSALILARGIVQKTPTMLIIGHNSTLGERYDYHGATRLVAEPVLRALSIPYHVLYDPAHIRNVVIEAQATVEGGSACPSASSCRATLFARSERVDEPNRRASIHRRPAQRCCNDYQSWFGELPDR